MFLTLVHVPGVVEVDAGMDSGTVTVVGWAGMAVTVVVEVAVVVLVVKVAMLVVGMVVVVWVVFVVGVVSATVKGVVDSHFVLDV